MPPQYLKRYFENNNIGKIAYIAPNLWEAIADAFYPILSDEAKENLGAILADIEEQEEAEAQRQREEQERKAKRACELMNLGAFEYLDRCRRLENGKFEYYASEEKETLYLSVSEMARIYDTSLSALDD